RAAEPDRLVVERLAVLRERLGVGGDAALLVEDLALDLGAAPVLQDDLDAARQERELAKPAPHARVVEAVYILEDVVVRVERYDGAPLAVGLRAHDVEWL